MLPNDKMLNGASPMKLIKELLLVNKIFLLFSYPQIRRIINGLSHNLPLAHCILPTALCQLPTALCKLPFANCQLKTANCLLPFAN
jgi:hypothetical protein